MKTSLRENAENLMQTNLFPLHFNLSLEEISLVFFFLANFINDFHSFTRVWSKLLLFSKSSLDSFVRHTPGFASGLDSRSCL